MVLSAEGCVCVCVLNYEYRIGVLCNIYDTVLTCMLKNNSLISENTFC